jgi:hypothetical protein
MSQENVYLASYAIPEDLKINADVDRLANAIAGLALELFAGQKDVFLQISQTQNSLLVFNITGKYTVDSDQFIELINSTKPSHYNTKSAHRLRLPLSKKVLQVHGATVSASVESNDEDEIVVHLHFSLAMMEKEMALNNATVASHNGT